MAPIFFAKTMQRAAQVRLLRSRLFFIVAFMTTMGELGGAISTTVKLVKRPEDSTAWIFWAAVVMGWIYFALVLVSRYWDLRAKRRAGR
ncbi:hypothetical protein M1D55_19215 [Cupriavidus sp. JZ107]